MEWRKYIPSYMTTKLVGSVLVVVGVIYLTVPIVKLPIWTKAENVIDKAEMGLAADYSIIYRWEKGSLTAYHHTFTEVRHGHCDDISGFSIWTDKDKVKTQCKNAKVAHTALVLSYILYLAGALYHSHAPEDKRNRWPLWIHVLLLLASWSFLLVLFITHYHFLEANHKDGGSKTVKMEWNDYTLIVIIGTLALQFIDLLMSLKVYFLGGDYKPALYGAHMYDHVTAM